jgi:hypothetical protein
MKTEDFSTNRKGKREYLNDSLAYNLMRNLNEHFKKRGDSKNQNGKESGN